MPVMNGTEIVEFLGGLSGSDALSECRGTLRLTVARGPNEPPIVQNPKETRTRDGMEVALSVAQCPLVDSSNE
jgi:hypothetical protein